MNPDLKSVRTRLLLVQLALVLGVCGFVFFFGLGSFGLVGADEPRYAQIGREMLARHDWIVPTLNGTPWLEKPVLLYWQEMASLQIFRSTRLGGARSFGEVRHSAGSGGVFLHAQISSRQ